MVCVAVAPARLWRQVEPESSRTLSGSTSDGESGTVPLSRTSTVVSRGSQRGRSSAARDHPLYHVAIRYPKRAALGDAFRRLVAADWPLDGFDDHGTHEALYLSDPDGNGLELCSDRPEAQWPRDAESHLTFGDRRLDLDGLLSEGAE
jgi:catechol-2,3-dioxygenase